MQGWRDNMEDSTPTPFITDMAESGNGPKPVGLVDAQSVGQVATAPQVQAAPVFAGQHQESSPVTNVLPAVFEKGPLLQNVRGLLRGNLENKQKWCAFCQMHGTTNFRPEVQDEAFLLTFMDALQSGGIPEFEGTVPPELQEASDWKGCGKAGGKAGDAWGGKSAMGGDAWGGKGAKAGGGGGGNVGKVFVGGLPKTTTEQVVQAYFQQWGAVSNINMKYGEDGMCKGFAFVTFADPSIAQSVVAGSQAGTTMIDGKWIDCKEVDQSASGQKGVCEKSWDGGKGCKGGKMALGWDGGKGCKGGKGGGWDTASNGSWGGSTTASSGGADGKVFVGGLPKAAPEAAIQAFFSQYGAINNILMKYDETGTSRGFCFVEFQDPSVAQQVMAASQAGSTIFEGKWIDCKDATPGGGKGGKDGGKDGGKGAKRQKVDEWGGWSAGGGGGWDKGSKGGFGKGCKGMDGGKTGGFGKGKDGGKDFGKKGGGCGGGDEPEKIFVGGLPRTTTEASLHAHFMSFGSVSKVEMKYDPDGNFRGFGFVTFADRSGADTVVSNYENNNFESKWIDCKPVGGCKGGGKGGK